MHYEHPDLRENVDAVAESLLLRPGRVPRGRTSHGTAVAGLVAARDNDIGMRGVAPRATIYAYDLTAFSALLTRTTSRTP